MRFIFLFGLFCAFVSASNGQSLPDSLRPQIEIRVDGEIDLSSRIKEHISLNLIAAEATVVDHSDQWILNISSTRSEIDNNVVAISMIATQPNLYSEKETASAEDADVESGEWVKAYLEKEYAEGLSKIQQHEVVITEATNIDRGARELVDRFRHRFLDSIKEMHLRRLQNH